LVFQISPYKVYSIKKVKEYIDMVLFLAKQDALLSRVAVQFVPLDENIESNA